MLICRKNVRFIKSARRFVRVSLIIGCYYVYVVKCTNANQEYNAKLDNYC